MIDRALRQRCYDCFRPVSLCFCEAIPSIDNRTDVLLLQHVGERFHRFNTARIVRKALRRCELIVDHNQRFASRQLPLHENAGLLYPSADGTSLTELPPSARPSQLVIVDGTWHQAKTILRDVPQLRTLPCYRLTPSTPGQYRIRREPNEHSLSTVEATVAALQALEPDTAGLHQLLSAFHKMVNDQLGHLAAYGVWRKKRSRQSQPRDVPRALLQSPDSLVVAYGEATPGQQGQRTVVPLPVNWVAQRLSTRESFSCLLRQEQPLSEGALAHMRITAAEFGAAISLDEFHQRWDRFLRPNDTLVVYHARTIQLLHRIEAARPPCLVLKSVFGKRQTGFRSLEELAAAEELHIPDVATDSRASQRLKMAIALVEKLQRTSLDAAAL